MAGQSASARTDEQIQHDVLDELNWDPMVRPNEVGVSVRDGIVALTGWVDTYLKRWAAEEAAHRVRDVKAVANDLEVCLPSAAERTDANLAAAALSALKWDAALSTDQLEVTVSNGQVTLQGEVDWNVQRDDAERVVRRLAGIKGVRNLITVKPHPTPADIQQKIERALIRNAQTDAQQITVELQGSTVVLKGTVRSYAEKQAAQTSAWAAPGITAVENRITVSPVFEPRGG